MRVGAWLKVIGFSATFCRSMVWRMRVGAIAGHHGVARWSVIAVAIAPSLAMAAIGSWWFGTGCSHLAIGSRRGALALTGFVLAHALHHF